MSGPSSITLCCPCFSSYSVHQVGSLGAGNKHSTRICQYPKPGCITNTCCVTALHPHLSHFLVVSPLVHWSMGFRSCLEAVFCHPCGCRVKPKPSGTGDPSPSQVPGPGTVTNQSIVTSPGAISKKAKVCPKFEQAVLELIASVLSAIGSPSTVAYDHPVSD
jgi:hypothetical protein